MPRQGPVGRGDHGKDSGTPLTEALYYWPISLKIEEKIRVMRFRGFAPDPARGNDPPCPPHNLFRLMRDASKSWSP